MSIVIIFFSNFVMVGFILTYFEFEIKKYVEIYYLYKYGGSLSLH